MALAKTRPAGVKRFLSRRASASFFFLQLPSRVNITPGVTDSPRYSSFAVNTIRRHKKTHARDSVPACKEAGLRGRTAFFVAWDQDSSWNHCYCQLQLAAKSLRFLRTRNFRAWHTDLFTMLQSADSKATIFSSIRGLNTSVYRNRGSRNETRGCLFSQRGRAGWWLAVGRRKRDSKQNENR